MITCKSRNQHTLTRDKALTTFGQTQPLRLFRLGRKAVSHDGSGRAPFEKRMFRRGLCA